MKVFLFVSTFSIVLLAPSIHTVCAMKIHCSSQYRTECRAKRNILEYFQKNLYKNTERVKYLTIRCPNPPHSCLGPGRRSEVNDLRRWNETIRNEILPGIYGGGKSSIVAAQKIRDKLKVFRRKNLPLLTNRDGLPLLARPGRYEKFKWNPARRSPGD